MDENLVRFIEALHNRRAVFSGFGTRLKIDYLHRWCGLMVINCLDRDAVMNETGKEPLLLVYDKQCPLCDAYCRWTRIRDSVGELRLIDARNDSDITARITAEGLDIDQGMVLIMNGVFYYGTDAIHALALISGRSSFFNRLNYHIFKSKRLSGVLYPFFRFCRKILLRCLGVKKINNLNLEDNENF